RDAELNGDAALARARRRRARGVVGGARRRAPRTGADPAEPRGRRPPPQHVRVPRAGVRPLAPAHESRTARHAARRGRGRAAAHVPQVRALGQLHARLRLGRARRRAAQRAPHALPRLDDRPARRRPLRARPAPSPRRGRGRPLPRRGAPARPRARRPAAPPAARRAGLGVRHPHARTRVRDHRGPRRDAGRRAGAAALGAALVRRPHPEPVRHPGADERCDARSRRLPAHRRRELPEPREARRDRSPCEARDPRHARPEQHHRAPALPGPPGALALAQPLLRSALGRRRSHPGAGPPPPMIPEPLQRAVRLMTRRGFFATTGTGLGSAALAHLLDRRRRPDFRPRAQRAIWLFMAGAPSQLDTFDHKPGLAERFDEDLPESIRRGQRLTTMTSGQARFPVAPSKYRFTRHDNGGDGADVSELLPFHGRMVRDLAIVKSCWTEAINHDPAITYLCTGRQLPGWPSLGAWLSYGLGAIDASLPAFVVMTPSWSGRKDAQALYQRLWGAGMLPSEHQGVALRAKGDP